MIEGFGSDVYVGSFVGIISFVIVFKLLHWIFGDHYGNVQPNDQVNEAEDSVRPPVYNPNCCPICLCGQSLALETNCGHLYCGTCLQTHYSITSRGDSSGILCALCRQRVVLIFICFNQEERQMPSDHNNLQTRDDVIRFVRMYNRIVRNDLTLTERILELPVLLRHLIVDTFRGERLEHNYFRIRVMLFMIFTFIYVLVPFDVIPEFVFGIYGYIEDILLFFIMTGYLVIVYRNYIATE